MPAKSIAICNFKGGVGKTVLAVNLATALANRLQKGGGRVLLMDLDSQANASAYMAGRENWRSQLYPNSAKSLFGVLERNLSRGFQPITADDLVGGEDALLFWSGDRRSHWTNLFLLPSHHDLWQMEDRLAAEGRRGIALTGMPREIMPFELLHEVSAWARESFDYIILDCPPGNHHLVQNALFTAENILVPVIPDWLSSGGLARLIHTLVEHFQRFQQTSKSVRAIVPTLWDNRLSVFNDHKARLANSLYEDWKTEDRLKKVLKGCELWDGLRRSGPVANLVEDCRPIVDLSPGDPARSQLETMVELISGW
ncbi:MAG: AAA family ATPase [bacterium]|nr:AAA family ATPase [bacterium]